MARYTTVLPPYERAPWTCDPIFSFSFRVYHRIESSPRLDRRSGTGVARTLDGEPASVYNLPDSQK